MTKQCLFAPCFVKRKEWKRCGVIGIQTLIQRSLECDDALHVQLKSLLESEGDTASVSCHKSWYSSYTSESRNVSSSKKKSGSFACHDGPPQRASHSQVSVFVVNRDCLFCGEICMPKDPKNPQKWVPVHQCETETRPG